MRIVVDVLKFMRLQREMNMFGVRVYEYVLWDIMKLKTEGMSTWCESERGCSLRMCIGILEAAVRGKEYIV